MRWTHALRARLHLLSRRAAEARMNEEMRFHLELEAEKYVREGMSPAEARRRAVLAFGGVEGHKEAMRDGRTFAWTSGLSLDLKLAWRMLRKYPGLTLVGGAAIAFAIWVGVGTFEFVFQVVHPTLPFDGGARVVGIRSWNAASSEMQSPGLRDFEAWKEELRSVRDLGAYRTVERNLITGDGRGEPVAVAEISASAFPVTRVRPLLGRPLTADDEAAGAPPVVVIGHDVWRRRFAGDPRVVGRVVRLGREQATVVGVMPEGFGFPWAHDLWMPLRLNALDYGSGEEPTVGVFGRLAPGASLDEAQAELSALGRRTAAAFPETHEHLRPRVMPYASSLLDLRGWMSLGLLSMNVFILALLVLVCGNVALLMFARAATREREIVVRNALGASRGRIMAQLFTEALLLAALAGTVGLGAAGYGLRWGMRIVETQILEGGRLPFWFHGSLSPASVIYAGVLTVLAATIAGVVPALKMTTRGLEGRLRESGASGGPRFGGVWTAVIVAQVAVTVLFPVITYYVQRDMRRVRAQEAGFAAEQYLSVRLEMAREASVVSGDTSRAAFAAHFRATYDELERRLRNEPGVTGVTFASNVPRRYHGWQQIEVDSGAVLPLDSVRGHRVSNASVAPDYLDVLGARVVAGRGFHSGDFRPEAHVVIANRSFVEKVLGGRNAVGRRVRYVASDYGGPRSRDEPWYEIVGVAPDLGMTSGYGEAGLYHPLPADAGSPVYMLVHVRGEPEALAPRLQRLAAAVDPTLRLHDVVPLDQIDAGELQFYDFWLRLTALSTLVALVLSWAGIYAVMSFAVSRRTREIGIRVALGASARRVVLAIFRRPLVQVTLGVGLGAVLILGLRIAMSDPGHEPSTREVATFVAYAAVMLGVCLLACVVPTRRALRVQPTEALREE
jgi:predicted permease